MADPQKKHRWLGNVLKYVAGPLSFIVLGDQGYQSGVPTDIPGVDGDAARMLISAAVMMAGHFWPAAWERIRGVIPAAVFSEDIDAISKIIADLDQTNADQNRRLAALEQRAGIPPIGTETTVGAV